jgi:hypothetical protein
MRASQRLLYVGQHRKVKTLLRFSVALAQNEVNGSKQSAVIGET